MSKSQEFSVSAPLQDDRQTLADFASTIQRNFEDVFAVAHDHAVKTAAPSSQDGVVGDVVPVVISGSYYLYIKFPTVGWKRVSLS